MNYNHKLLRVIIVSDRVILHVDCNSFFASVSLLYKPHLKTYPVVVGGSEETRHGIVLAKNQEAKKYKIPTGAALWQARQLCPNLVVIPPDYDLYDRFSKEIKGGIFADYTDMQESFGSDESWLDVTGSTSLFGGGGEIADIIRNRVKREIGITVSVGVSWNKIFAKLGSDMKKPDAVTVIDRDTFTEIVWPLPVEELLYVGPATTRKLHNKGVYTIGQLANTKVQYLKDWFGVVGEYLWIYANGLENSPVGQTAPPVKSVGNSSVIPHDVTTPKEVKRRIHMLAESVGPRMREHGFAARTICIWICDNDMGHMSRQRGLAMPTNLNHDLAGAAFSLFQDTYKWHKPIRKIGISGSNLVFAHDPFQCSIFESAEQHDRREKLEATMDSINKRWRYAVKRGITMFDDGDEERDVKDMQRQFTPIGWL